MVPWPHPSPQPKRHLDRFSRFCRDHCSYQQTDTSLCTPCTWFIAGHSTNPVHNTQLRRRRFIRAFPVARVWNDLPPTVRALLSLLTFRQQLKTFLFHRTFYWLSAPATLLNVKCHWNQFCSLAVLDPRVGHTMDVLSPLILVLCHSDGETDHGETDERRKWMGP